jgi:hypothetical protein
MGPDKGSISTIAVRPARNCEFRNNNHLLLHVDITAADSGVYGRTTATEISVVYLLSVHY